MSQPRVVEAERATYATRMARDADAVLIGRGARFFQTADERAETVLASSRARRLPLRARALEVRCPTVIHQPNRRRQQLQRQLVLHLRTPPRLLIHDPLARARNLARLLSRVRFRTV